MRKMDNSATTRDRFFPPSGMAMRKMVLVFILIGAVLAQPQSASENKSARYLVVKHADVPVYPGFLRIAHVSGVVQLKVTVEAGVVVSTVVKSGQPLLARVTEDNVKTWEFWPDANATFTTTFVYRIEKGKPEVSGESSNPRIELNLPTLVKITAMPLVGPIG